MPENTNNSALRHLKESAVNLYHAHGIGFKAQKSAEYKHVNVMFIYEKGRRGKSKTPSLAVVSAMISCKWHSLEIFVNKT